MIRSSIFRSFGKKLVRDPQLTSERNLESVVVIINYTKDTNRRELSNANKTNQI
jgi:hypothetical protein